MPLGKYGRLPRREGKRLHLAKYLSTASLPTPPASVDWSSKVASWPIYGNDKIGDCTCAAVGHLLQSWTANEGVLSTPSDASILIAYEAVSGYNPATGANDNGADLLTICEYWAKTGISGNRLKAYVELPTPLDPVLWQQATNLFGGLYIGLNLPRSAEEQFGSGQEWDVAMFPGGIVGGHCVPVHGYDANGVIVTTWGQTHRATWRFMDRYCDEAYALLDTAWCPSNAPVPWLSWYVDLYDSLMGDARPPVAAPNGLDWATLQADFAAL